MRYRRTANHCTAVLSEICPFLINAVLKERAYSSLNELFQDVSVKTVAVPEVQLCWESP
jgi:hypothetical protein